VVATVGDGLVLIGLGEGPVEGMVDVAAPGDASGVAPTVGEGCGDVSEPWSVSTTARICCS
jgi:hypothetical protein